MQAKSFRSGRRHGNARPLTFAAMKKVAKSKSPKIEGPASGLWHLAGWRAYRQWTQEQVAEKIGTTKGTISKLEKGDLDMSEGWIKRYADAFGIPPGHLMRAPDEAEPAPQLAEPIEGLDPDEVRIALETLARRTGMIDNAAKEVAALFLEELLDQQSPVLDQRTAELRVAFDRIVRRFAPKAVE